MASPRLTPSERQAILDLLTETRPAVVYLFGSKGTSREHPGSDIDIAILPKASPGSPPALHDPVRLLQLANDLSDALGTEVDLVDLTTASTVFRKEVLRTGARIATFDEGAAAEFEMYTLADYARLNEEHHAIVGANLDELTGPGGPSGETPIRP